jgi:N-methylhydantoinase B
VPDGEYSFRERIDSDAVTDRSYFVDVTLRKSGDEIEFDLSASDRQATGPINFLMDDSVPKFMLGLYMTMDEPGIGMNGGFERAVKRVITRPGSIVAPKFPAPLGLRSHSMIRVTTSTFGALAQAMGGHASAASCVYVLYYLRGRNTDGSEPLCIEGLAVGFGARTFADGIDAVYYVAQENYPIEFAEMEFGVEIERFGVHCDSGGPGRWRGGCGIVRDVRVLSDEAVLGIRLDNCRQPAFGVNGGRSGQPGRVIVNPGSTEERDLATMSDNNPLKKGDLVRIITSGGGGWGSPLDRPAADVLADVLDGFVSSEAAFTDYGVAIVGEAVDEAATEAKRAAMPRPPEMFHRGRPYNAADDRHD